MADDLHCQQSHQQIHHAVQKQRRTQEHGQRLRPLAGPQHQQHAQHTGARRRQQDGPPAVDAEALGVHGDLHLEQPVRQHQNAVHHAQKADGLAGMGQCYDAQGDQQHAEGQIVLEGQPEQVTGQIPRHLHGTKHDHPDAQQLSDDGHRHAGPHKQHHAQHAQQHRHDDVSCFGRSHRSHRTHDTHLPHF